MPSILTKHVPRYEGLFVTREEYLDLEEDGFQYDVINGVMHLSPSGEFEHAERTGSFIIEIGSYLKKNKLGKVVAEIDVLLPDGGDPIRPDISFILSENMRIVKKHILGTPDLVCEILSPSAKKNDLGEKADRYLACGVKEYWIVEPHLKTIEVWKNNQKKSWNKFSGQILKSEILPGFQISLDEFFD